jgi:hypothetical protein
MGLLAPLAGSTTCCQAPLLSGTTGKLHDVWSIPGCLGISVAARQSRSAQQRVQQRSCSTINTCSTKSTSVSQHCDSISAGVALYTVPGPGGQDQGGRRRRDIAAAEGGRRRAGWLRGAMRSRRPCSVWQSCTLGCQLGHDWGS